MTARYSPRWPNIVHKAEAILIVYNRPQPKEFTHLHHTVKYQYLYQHQLRRVQIAIFNVLQNTNSSNSYLSLKFNSYINVVSTGSRWRVLSMDFFFHQIRQRSNFLKLD